MKDFDTVREQQKNGDETKKMKDPHIINGVQGSPVDI